jgi:hypothetical protein
MSEVIEFVGDWFAEVEGDVGRMRQVAFPRGTLLRADVSHAEKGPTDTADLHLADGTTARRVPLSRIAIVGSSKAA